MEDVVGLENVGDRAELGTRPDGDAAFDNEHVQAEYKGWGVFAARISVRRGPAVMHQPTRRWRWTLVRRRLFVVCPSNTLRFGVAFSYVIVCVGVPGPAPRVFRASQARRFLPVHSSSKGVSVLQAALFRVAASVHVQLCKHNSRTVNDVQVSPMSNHTPCIARSTVTMTGCHNPVFFRIRYEFRVRYERESARLLPADCCMGVILPVPGLLVKINNTQLHST